MKCFLKVGCLEQLILLFLVPALQVMCKPSKPAAAPSGQSSVAYSQDHKGNYQFAYEITDKVGASNFRQESRSGKVVRGSYGLTDVDGRTRLVNYQADKHGFVAAIDTNEPGTSREDAASAIYNGPDKGKGWAYAVSLQQQNGAASGKSDKKSAEYSTSSGSSLEMDDEHRYTSNGQSDDDDRPYVRDEYSPASTNVASPPTSRPKVSTSNERPLQETPLSAPNAMPASVGGNSGGSSSNTGSASSGSTDNSDHTDGDTHSSDSPLNEFNDDKTTSQYSDVDKAVGVDEEPSGPEVDITPTNEYEYRRREFGGQKVVTAPSSYSQTVQRLARDRFKSSKNIYQSSKRSRPTTMKILEAGPSTSSVVGNSRSRLSVRPVRVANSSKSSFVWK
jgi:hypothetical protein